MSRATSRRRRAPTPRGHALRLADAATDGELGAMIAHELRGPLAGIGGALRMLGTRCPGRCPDGVVVGALDQRVRQLTEMVEHLLLFGRSEHPERAVVPLAKLVRDTSELLAEWPTACGTTVSVEGRELEVVGDAELLKGLFLNLLRNAAEAMGSGGVVRVTLRRLGHSCRVVVADEGPGLPAEFARRVFDPFVSGKPHGSGLGLFIARRVVEAHGGTIRARPAPSGRGTRFVIDLPLGAIR